MDSLHEAQALYQAAFALRENNVSQAISCVESAATKRLNDSAWGVSDNKLAALPPDWLEVWQMAKAYFAQYPMEEHAWSPFLRKRLSHVPWSEQQLAKQAFHARYGQGKLEVAPPVEMTHWIGTTLSEKDTRGRVLLLDFWNTHCAVCVVEMPLVQRIHDTYKDQGLVVISCALGSLQETEDFLKAKGYTFPVGMCSHKMALDYAVPYNPAHFLIDRTGRLVWGPQAGLPTDAQLMALIHEQNVPSPESDQTNHPSQS